MHYQHKIKCLNCSLHYIVLSEHEEWPQNGADARNGIFCPECGSAGTKILWKPEEHDEFIFQVVPGETHTMELH